MTEHQIARIEYLSDLLVSKGPRGLTEDERDEFRKLAEMEHAEAVRSEREFAEERRMALLAGESEWS